MFSGIWWGFHHRLSCQLTGKKPWRFPDGGWGDPPLGELVRQAGLEEVKTYITRRHNTFAQYIVTRPIMELCDEAE